MINEMNKQTVKEIRKQIDDALQQVTEKFGIKLSLGNITYTDYDFKVAIKGEVVEAADGRDIAKEKFETDLIWCRGVDPKWFGKVFEHNGKVFKVVGLNTRARKQPIKLEDVNTGRKYKASPVMIKGFLGE